MARYLLSYRSGVVGNPLPTELKEAVDAAVQRCAACGEAGNVIDMETYNVIARIKRVNGEFVATRLTQGD